MKTYPDHSKNTALPTVDAEGYTICPDCGSRINCGTVGLANLKKCHHGKKVCKAAQEKRDKLTKRSQNGTIPSFLKPKATFVPLTLSSPALIHSSQQLAPPSPSVTTALQEPKPHLVSRPINDFVNKLQNLVNNLPRSVPEALESDTLAVLEETQRNLTTSLWTLMSYGK